MRIDNETAITRGHIGIRRDMMVVIPLFLFSLVFKDYYTFAAVFCVLALIYSGVKLCNTKSSLFLLAFALVYCVIYVYNYGFSNTKMWECILVYLMYKAGYALMQKVKNAERIILIPIFGLVIHSTIVFFTGIINNQVTVGLNAYRVYYDVFSGMQMNATGIEAYYIPFIGALAYVYTKSKVPKVLTLLYTLLVLAACVITGSRGAIVILLVTVLACVWVKTKTEKTTGKLSIATKTILTISIGALLSILLYQLNVFGVRDFLKSSSLLFRLSFLSEQGTIFDSAERITQNSDILRNLGSIWLTGGKKIGYEFVHNTWLSIVNEVGIIPALCLFIVHIRTFVMCTRKLLSTKDSLYLLLFGLELCMILFMMIEPTYDSAAWMVMLFSFYAGVQDKICVRRDFV